MNILLSFAPFIAFALLDGRLSTVAAMAVAALISAVQLTRDAINPTRHVKLLEAGTMLLFGGLALWAWLTQAHWSVLGVRLRVDLGLLAIVLVSMVLRQPFTLQYAKESVPDAYWKQPAFLRINQVLTGVWAFAFALMVVADLLMLYVPAVPLWVGVVVTLAALGGAGWFTRWFPQRMRAAK